MNVVANKRLLTVIGLDAPVGNPESADADFVYSGSPQDRFKSMEDVLTAALNRKPEYMQHATQGIVNGIDNRIVFLAPEWYFSRNAVVANEWVPFNFGDLKWLREAFIKLSEKYPYVILAPGTVRFYVEMPHDITNDAELLALPRTRLIFNAGGVYLGGKEVLFHCKRHHAGDCPYNNLVSTRRYLYFYDFSFHSNLALQRSWYEKLQPFTDKKYVPRLDKAIKDQYGAELKLDEPNGNLLVLDAGKPSQLVIGHDICADHGDLATSAKSTAAAMGLSIDLMLVVSAGRSYDNLIEPPLSVGGFGVSCDATRYMPKDMGTRGNFRPAGNSVMVRHQEGADKEVKILPFNHLVGTTVCGQKPDAFYIWEDLELNTKQNVVKKN